MPRYFFNVDGESPDRDGTVFTGLEAVRSEAIRTAGEMIRDWDGDLPGDEWGMQVTKADRTVLTLEFRAIEHA